MRGDVVGEVLLRGARVVGIGLVLGVPAALGAAQLLASELYEVGASDPMVIGTTAATVIVVAVIACLVPAWRAAMVEPVTALRAD